MKKKKESTKNLIKRLNKSTLSIKKQGKKYKVKDVVEFDGDFGLLTAKQIRRRFG